MRWSDFSLNDVKVLDKYSVSVSQKVVDFIGSYNPDRLLYNFRVAAGLQNKSVVNMPYPGWENGRIGGHTMGHYIAACAQGVAHGYGDCTGNDGRTIKQRLDYIVEALEECQISNDKMCEENSEFGDKGFIFGAILDKDQKPEWQFDKLDAKNPEGTWVPWYTMHKIVNGLIAAYTLAGNDKALKIVENLGEWIYRRVVKWDDETKYAVLSVEYGGMNDCLYELYRIAKNTGYADADHFAIAAHQFDEDRLFELVAGGAKDSLDNKHANCTIPKFMGALNRYLVLGDEKYLKYAESFWNLVVNHHTYVTGGNSECEFFGKDDVLDAERSNTNCETCNTHNMLKFTRSLFQLTGEKKYAEYYEHTYFNAILASGNKYTGMTTYFQPMATGCFKVYCNKDLEKNYFWCCSGTGLENFTKLGDSFYFYNDNSLLVNVYESSSVVWKDKGIFLVQKTELENGQKVSLVFEEAKGENVQLVLRIPDWAESVSLKENDAELEGGDFAESLKKGWICLNKCWNRGDEISLEFGTSVRAYGLPDSENVFAFKYGPVVLAAELGTDDEMTLHQVGVQCDVCGKRIVNGEKQDLLGSYFHTTGIGKLKDEKLQLESVCDENGKVISIWENPALYFERKKSEEVCFMLKTENWNKPLKFTPYYKLHEQRYGIYWEF